MRLVLRGDLMAGAAGGAGGFGAGVEGSSATEGVIVAGSVSVKNGDLDI